MHLDRGRFAGRRPVDDGQLDGEDAVLVARGRPRRVDVLGEAHPAAERAEVDLHLLVDALGYVQTLALTCDDQHPFGGDDVEGRRVDARQLDDDRERVRLVGVEAVDVRAEAVAQACEAGHLPELGEELFDLLVQPVATRHAGSVAKPDVAPSASHRMMTAMEILKPRWSSSTFLVYAGALTVAGALTDALTYLASSYDDPAYAAWSLLVLAVLLALAVAWRERRPLTAGVFAFVAVIAFGAFVGALWVWFGWGIGSSPLRGFDVARLSAVLLIVLFAVAAVRRFRHPLLALPVAALSWFFVTDLISNGGNWSAVVTLVVGLVLLLVGATLDVGLRRPYGFWVHAVAGLTIGGALIYWWHSGDWHWALVAIAGLVYIRVSSATGRSSWAVFGAIGLFAAATHFAIEWWHRSIPFLGGGGGAPRDWVPPVVFAVLGFGYVALGAVVSRRERRSPLPSGD